MISDRFRNDPLRAEMAGRDFAALFPLFLKPKWENTMPAEVETMMYVGNPPWHRHGVALENPPSALSLPKTQSGTLRLSVCFFWSHGHHQAPGGPEADE